MNSDTVFLFGRPFQEVVDDILTSIVGGEVNEAIIFDKKLAFYQLQKPAEEGRVFVTGTAIEDVDGEEREVRRTFQRDTDYEFIPGNEAAIVWQPNGGAPNGATLPVDESTFHVDYIPSGRTSPLSDINVGSVTRTICEAVGREIATVYQQINQAYLSGFIDTAEGKSLDLVVSILGVKRRINDFAEGFVTFFRDPSIPGAISIPTGTLLTTSERVRFQTRQIRTLQSGQARIDVLVRATDEFKGEAGRVPAGAINALVQQLAGIQRVTNVDPTALGGQDETDEELRERAKAALQGLGKGTLRALRFAVNNAGIKTVEIYDPNEEDDSKKTPRGEVVLIINDEPERVRRAERAVHETRAAGVRATFTGLFVYFTPKLKVRIESIGLAAGELKIKDDIILAMQQYVDGLSAGKPALGKELLAAIKRVEGVLTSADPADDPKFVEVVASRADQKNDGQRIPDRSLVQLDPEEDDTTDGTSNERATDEQIAGGNFKVIPFTPQYSVVLEIAAADIELREPDT
jgi:hypothetical protein